MRQQIQRGSTELLQDESADMGSGQALFQIVASNWWSDFAELYLLLGVMPWNHNFARKFYDPVISQASFLTRRKKSQPDFFFFAYILIPHPRKFYISKICEISKNIQ